ncbi:hypothetical protein K431DRAFT_220306 [Polychaeton citri CBS 116435]|uniref:Protein phosphatase n=1 Tax=Polychaeton citri CBS 116435 TaxID=1314669 RepID=A0A9P4QCP0_9PEZI|nr:hypothetical protein K431DRAFT_220306 [Polychaeton citri CBS 116435]
MSITLRIARSACRDSSKTAANYICVRRFFTALPKHDKERERNERRKREPTSGLTTPVPEESNRHVSKSPFYFEAGYAAWAKRHTRPFPPPFFSPPSGSFSDPLSTHHKSRDLRGHSEVNGHMIRGITNGDDALLVSDNLIGCNDGVGAWAQRERGHAPLWSRLILHFLAVAAEKNEYGGSGQPDPVKYLSEAYDLAKEALSDPNDWFGTTTSVSALIHHKDEKQAMLYVTQLGDSTVLVVRPSDGSVIFSTVEQWHYFDCPRQLGTNSPDTPDSDAKLDIIEIQEGDIVLAMSDGVTDNLWEHEISENVISSLENWRKKDVVGRGTHAEGMKYVAQELVIAAKTIAEDPFAESPFMERAIDEGLAIEGGKLDDISVVAALCQRKKT